MVCCEFLCLIGLDDYVDWCSCELLFYRFSCVWGSKIFSWVKFCLNYWYLLDLIFVSFSEVFGEIFGEIFGSGDWSIVSV